MSIKANVQPKNSHFSRVIYLVIFLIESNGEGEGE
jgi:hypothetical protein